ncbi:carbonic anhydrase 2-like [Ctenocephalides felis]|uniref:carbonic anhydrase 2-like n=1 Tax=Ctenocephalides felis TaxID=7515 RepID=UPI000E6E5239|nr:carbonic anhydrase 2-like [Ctenocephalides felis]
MKIVELPPLIWTNYQIEPKKIKATNTGHTLIISAKWHVERPYLRGGPLIGKYVFSQLHFHWGRTCMEGSEHTVDGTQMPMEMHVVHFKTSYLTQESALREKDGVVLVAYLFKLQATDNPLLTTVLKALESCREPHTSTKLPSKPISELMKYFDSDYCVYWS